MGRPKGDGARLKSRPSSSSQSASLLHFGTTTLGFGGYSGSRRIDSSFSTDDTNLLTDIDSDLCLHLRRLGKKDPITKLKALDSLSMLLNQKSGKDVIPIIPQWVFEYKRLLLDYNREVRRATNETMTKLVIAVGRDLAPHLKSLMGPWWFAQFDPVPEVSRAAKKSLQAAFPSPEKRLDALMLYVYEIFVYFEDNLKLTPKTMSDRTAASDEIEEMHQHVISSSLFALATCLDIVCMHGEISDFKNIISVPKHAFNAKETVISFAEKIFAEHKYFLNLLTSQTVIIRLGTYSVLRSYIENVPSAFKDSNIRKTAMNILGTFKERNPSCHLAMWDTIILFSKTYPDTWTDNDVQKPALNKFFSFIRSGFFGSQLISYTKLLPFLRSLPPILITGGKFCFEFFENLWGGRNSSSLLHEEIPGFLGVYKECFLWALYEASSYFMEFDMKSRFKVMLVTDILVRILWDDFLSYSYSEGNVKSSLNMADDPEETTETLHGDLVETKISKYSSVYLECLGKCIVDVLSTISSLDTNLLSIFYTRFQEDCMKLFQKILLWRNVSDDAERMIKFFLLLDRHSVQKGHGWPFDQLVGPMLSKAFPFVKAHATVEAVNILSISVSIFGARQFVEKIYPNYKMQAQHLSGKFTNEQFLLVFKDIFIPWCLDEYKCSTGHARLDFLFRLVKEDCFSEQWDIIITHVKNIESFHVESSSLDFVDLLAFILEKAGEENHSLVAENSLECHQGFVSEKWHHTYIDSTAIFVINSSCVKDSHKRFMRAAMGGLTEDIKTSFLSRNVVISIFQAIFDIMLSFISKSPFSSFKEAVFLLLVGDHGYLVNFETSKTISKMTSLVYETLYGSHFLLNVFRKDDELVLGIAASLFIIEWEHSVLCRETTADVDSRFVVCESMHSVHNKITKQVFKNIDFRCRERTGDLLFSFIWSFVSKEEDRISDNMASLCSLWIIEVLEVLSENRHEEQKLLDLFLSNCHSWPLWIVPNFSDNRVAVVKDGNITNINVNAVCNTGAVIHMLISKLGFDRVVLGSVTSPSITVESENGIIPAGPGYPRAWLAAEMLCLCNWKVGFVSDSLLPSVVLYSKRFKFTADDPFLYPLVKLLVDGALILHESDEKITSLDIWTTSNDDLVHIEAPSTRAIFSLLLALFRDDNTWKNEEACLLFEFLLSKLYIGENVHINCLKLLPSLMNILVQPLCCRRGDVGEIIMDSLSYSFEGTQIHNILLEWMSKVARFPPLSSWKTELDNMAEWYHLVLSFYPLRFSGNKMIVGRKISPRERKLLFELFQKERSQGSASLPAVVDTCPNPTLLPKLISATVAYCGDDFGEEEWDFVFSNTRNSIEKSVVLIEELTENSTSSQSPSPGTAAMTIPSSFSQSMVISRYGLDLFSLICKFMVRHRAERWESFRDRVDESVLRILLCSGVNEAPSTILEATRLCDRRFCLSVSSVAMGSSLHSRERAMKAFKLWGRKRGPVGSLYAILFSWETLSSPPLLQVAAFVLLATEPVLNAAVVFITGSKEGGGGNMVYDVREELSSVIQKLPSQTSYSDVSVSIEELRFLLGWSLLLSFIIYLPPGAIKRRMIEYVEEDVDLGFLDVVIGYIPLELCTAQNLRKKEGGIPGGLKEAAEGATSAIESGSLLFAVESIWPFGKPEMATLCGAIYGLMLRVLPSYVRNWFSGIRDQSVSSAVENFTKSWCSPCLIADEFLQIKKSRLVDESFFVSMSRTANEVVSTYTKDETKMDLVIRLPPSYPLRTMDVDCPKGLGISEAKRRKWFMFMLSFVRNQNGSLAEAIQMWKRNIDREFDGVEECPICYSVIHAAIDTIPRLTCKTCKHKFHSPCLYKWFSTSHKSTCPLCQSLF